MSSTIVASEANATPKLGRGDDNWLDCAVDAAKQDAITDRQKLQLCCGLLWKGKAVASACGNEVDELTSRGMAKLSFANDFEGEG